MAHQLKRIVQRFLKYMWRVLPCCFICVCITIKYVLNSIYCLNCHCGNCLYMLNIAAISQLPLWTRQVIFSFWGQGWLRRGAGSFVMLSFLPRLTEILFQYLRNLCVLSLIKRSQEGKQSSSINFVFIFKCTYLLVNIFRKGGKGDHIFKQVMIHSNSKKY